MEERQVVIKKEIEEFFAGKLEDTMEKFRKNDPKGLEIMDYFLSKSSFADKVHKTSKFLDWELISDDGRKKLLFELLVETNDKEMAIVRIKIPMIVDDK